MSDERSAHGGCGRCARSTHPFLAVLGTAGVQRYEAVQRKRTFRRGQILFRQNEVADTVFCVSGATIRLVHRAGEREIVIGAPGCGELVGLAAAFGSGTHAYTAEVVLSGRVGEHRAADLEALAHEDAEFARALTAEVARDRDRLIRQMALMSHTKVAPRLAALLLELSERRDACPTSQVGAGLRRADLAAMCGVGMEAVVRCLSRWRREGVVADDQGAVVLRRRDALEAIAADSPRPESA